jgi:hypothetical protein
MEIFMRICMIGCIIWHFPQAAEAAEARCAAAADAWGEPCRWRAWDTALYLRFGGGSGRGRVCHYVLTFI